ncbi:MAG TPA: hypothetical protein VE089_09610, partial [Nitrososphaeraceae archaeon]|nr:hypothetical protein [Nitrososphaeraceae archaeon]
LYPIATGTSSSLLNNVGINGEANSIQINHTNHIDPSSWKKSVNTEPIYHNIYYQQLVCVQST